jgi:hypothetical protein
MLSPLPRRGGWASRPAVSAFPDIRFGSACASPFSRLAQRSLAVRPLIRAEQQKWVEYSGGCFGKCILECAGRTWLPWNLSTMVTGHCAACVKAIRLFGMALRETYNVGDENAWRRRPGPFPGLRWWCGIARTLKSTDHHRRYIMIHQNEGMQSINDACQSRRTKRASAQLVRHVPGQERPSRQRCWHAEVL